MQQSIFLLQTELVDAKVEVAVSRAIAPVIEQIVNLRQEMNQRMDSLRVEMYEMRHEFGPRLAAVETALILRKERQNQIRDRFLDYCFKAGWLAIVCLLSGLFSLLALHLHSVI